MYLFIGIVAFLIGIGVGYLVFYYRYKDTHMMNELRKTAKDYARELERIKHDTQEFAEQNMILKEKMTDLMSKNDDLSKVVSELSRYYYHIKQAIEKTKELMSIFGNVDKAIEEKISLYGAHKPTGNEHKIDVLHNKKKTHSGMF